MKLDARFISLIYRITDKDPNLAELNTDNMPEGALWINEATGKVFIAIKHPNNPAKIIWLAISKTPQDILSSFDFPTYNLIDIFNDNSIVAFYPFDGSAQDLANGYNGIWHGNEQYDEGVFGQATELDENTYLELPSDIISVFNNYSYSIWVYIPSSVSNWSIVALNARNKSASTNDSTNRKNGLLEIDPNKRLVHAAKGSADSDQLKKSIDFTFYLDKWVHIVYTQANNTHKVYINGQLIPELTIRTSGSVQLTDVGYANLAFVHYYTNTMREYAVGLRDQLRIFNRPLNDEEVIVLYNENYLIEKALSILIDKFKTYKEIVFFPAGDLPSIKTGQKFHGGEIGQVTSIKPIPIDTGKETIGKELYFPADSAIELKFDRDLTVPFTITMICNVQSMVQKLNCSDGYSNPIIGSDYNGRSSDSNFDLNLLYNTDSKKILFEMSENDTLHRWNSNISLQFGKYYLFVIKVLSNSAELRIYDFESKQLADKITFSTSGNLAKLFQNSIGLNSIMQGNNMICTGGLKLSINQFRIFNGELADEEIKLLLNEDKFYPIRTQYTPKVFVNKPTLNQDLVLFYNFDKVDTANKKVIDLSGNGYDGIWNGAARYDKGLFGRAAKFIGDSYISCNLQNSIKYAFTVSMWVNLTAQGNGTFIAVPNNQFGGFTFGQSTPGGNIGVWFASPSWYYRKSLTDLQIEYGKWYHYTVTVKSVDNSISIRLFINGNLVHSEQINQAPPSKQISTINIAWNPNGKNYYARNTLIDQLRIYKRALSADEIQALYREMVWLIK